MVTEGDIKKRAMIAALEASLGIVSTACREVGISRKTHYQWMKLDKEYKDAVDDISECALDFAESKLHSLIKNDDTTATIFYLKTKGKKRGYIERSEIEARVEEIKPFSWMSQNHTMTTNGQKNGLS